VIGFVIGLMVAFGIIRVVLYVTEMDYESTEEDIERGLRETPKKKEKKVWWKRSYTGYILVFYIGYFIYSLMFY
jgi:4-hydroxybenzoate polyprenyltransferase